jgi:hypothetical protein
MGVACYFIWSKFGVPDGGRAGFAGILKFVVTIVLGIIIYVLTAIALGVEEVGRMKEWVMGKGKAAWVVWQQITGRN